MLMNLTLHFVPNHDRQEWGRELAALTSRVGKAHTA